MGSFTGLSTAAYALAPLALPHFSRPTAAEFGWAVVLAVLVTVGCHLVFRLAHALLPVLTRWRLVTLPLAGLVIGGLAIGFDAAAGHGVETVLFSGQDALNPLVSDAAGWSLGALALLIAVKGVAWGISLAGFRGGPTFPALFLGAAGGMMAAHLPGFDFTAAVGVGMAAGVVGVLRLPLSGIVLGVLLTSKAGLGDSPLIVVGAVVATVTTAVLADRPAEPAPAPAPTTG
jgi:H+/Cl- antiporter ClcA